MNQRNNGYRGYPYVPYEPDEYYNGRAADFGMAPGKASVAGCGCKNCGCDDEDAAPSPAPDNKKKGTTLIGTEKKNPVTEKPGDEKKDPECEESEKKEEKPPRRESKPLKEPCDDYPEGMVNNTRSELKEPAYWLVNTSLLDDENYRRLKKRIDVGDRVILHLRYPNEKPGNTDVEVDVLLNEGTPGGKMTMARKWIKNWNYKTGQEPFITGEDALSLATDCEYPDRSPRYIQDINPMPIRLHYDIPQLPRGELLDIPPLREYTYIPEILPSRIQLFPVTPPKLAVAQPVKITLPPTPTPTPTPAPTPKPKPTPTPKPKPTVVPPIIPPTPTPPPPVLNIPPGKAITIQKPIEFPNLSGVMINNTNNIEQLTEILRIMKNNPTVKVTIIPFIAGEGPKPGYVYSWVDLIDEEGEKRHRALEKLWQYRADYLRNFLIRNGIDKDRILKESGKWGSDRKVEFRFQG